MAGGASIRSPAKRETVRLGDPRRREKEKGPIAIGKHSPPLSHPTYVPSVPAWKRKPTQNEAEARQRSWRPILPVGTEFLRQKARLPGTRGARERRTRDS